MRNKKTLLLVSPIMPNSNGVGFQKRCYHHLEALSKRYIITLLVLQPGNTEKAVKKLCYAIMQLNIIQHITADGNQYLPIHSQKIPFFTLANILIQGTQRFQNSPIANEEINPIRNQTFSLGFFFRIRTSQIAPILEQHHQIIFRKKVCDLDDIESEAKTLALVYNKKNIGFEATLIEKYRIRQHRNAEKWVLNTFDCAFVCSKIDKQKLLKRKHNATIEVIANSIRIPEKQQQFKNKHPLILLFVGNMSFPPNIDAMFYFCNDILPLIQHDIGSIELRITGYHPTLSIKNLATKQIIITGGIKNIQDAYQNSHLVIAPIRFGSGTRTKILEAMAYSRAVVATSMGAEGLDLIANEEIKIADNKHIFAQHCITLLRSEASRIKMANKAYKTVKRLYSVEVIHNTINQHMILSTTLAKRCTM